MSSNLTTTLRGTVTVMTAVLVGLMSAPESHATILADPSGGPKGSSLSPGACQAMIDDGIKYILAQHDCGGDDTNQLLTSFLQKSDKTVFITCLTGQCEPETVPTAVYPGISCAYVGGPCPGGSVGTGSHINWCYQSTLPFPGENCHLDGTGSLIHELAHAFDNAVGGNYKDIDKCGSQEQLQAIAQENIYRRNNHDECQRKLNNQDANGNSCNVPSEYWAPRCYCCGVVQQDANDPSGCMSGLCSRTCDQRFSSDGSSAWCAPQSQCDTGAIGFWGNCPEPSYSSICGFGAYC